LFQLRAGLAESRMAHGLWVVRLRSPFDKQTFPSAASDALREVAADELGLLLQSAARRVAAA
jgi:ribonuclease P protein component